MSDYLIWSNEHTAWWKPAHRGYTTVIHEAGRYTSAEADRIVAAANFNPSAPPNEVKCLAPSIAKLRYELARFLEGVDTATALANGDSR